LHVAVDALGNPLRIILSAGQIADIERAALIQSPQQEEIRPILEALRAWMEAQQQLVPEGSAISKAID
jgi:hypothetical protein